MRTATSLVTLCVAAALAAAAPAKPAKPVKVLSPKAARAAYEKDMKKLLNDLRVVMKKQTANLEIAMQDIIGKGLDDEQSETVRRWFELVGEFQGKHVHTLVALQSKKDDPNAKWVLRHSYVLSGLLYEASPVYAKAYLDWWGEAFRQELKVYPAKLKRATKDMEWIGNALEKVDKAVKDPRMTYHGLLPLKALFEFAGYRLKAIYYYVEETTKAVNKFLDDAEHKPAKIVATVKSGVLDRMKETLAKTKGLDPAIADAMGSWRRSLKRATDLYEDGYEATAKRYAKVRKGTQFAEVKGYFHGATWKQIVERTTKIDNNLRNRLEELEP